MVDMANDCERCRLQLMIEHNRLLAWGDAVGLIEVPNGSHVASSLGTNAVELCDILARIAWLLEKFKDINNRWQSNMISQKEHELLLREQQANKVDLGKQISGLAASYEADGEKRTQLRATQRLTAWISRDAENTKDILANPVRVRWVMADKESSEAFLEDLHSLTERIHGLMGDYKVEKFHERLPRLTERWLSCVTTQESLKSYSMLRQGLRRLPAVDRPTKLNTKQTTRRRFEIFCGWKLSNALLQKFCSIATPMLG